MRVLLVSRIFAPEPGAAPLRLGALTRAFLDRGDAVRVLTAAILPRHGAPADETPVSRAPVLRDRDGYVRGYLQYMSFDVPAFFRVLFARGFDVVVVEPPPTTGFFVRLAAALRRRPYAYYAADVWSDAAVSATSRRLIPRILRSVERWAWNGATVVLSVSEEVTKRLGELGVRAPIVTVGNGTDVARFSPDGPARSLGAPYFVYAGTASEVQGATIFVDAFALVLQQRPDARLVFLGQGTERDAIAAKSAELPPGSVVLEPARPAEETAEWLRGALASLASIQPTAGYDFAFPTKIYASVACGTPVVFAGPGPTGDYVRANDVGTAVDYSAEAVAAAMIAHLDAPADDARRRRRAEWAAENVSSRRCATRAVDAVHAHVSA